MNSSTFTTLSFSFLMIILLALPFSTFSRDDNSIDFVQKQSFKDVQDIAYEEGKPIFITFYATWSTPCAKMNEEVFHNSKVAEFMNANFVNFNANIESKIGKALSDYFEIYHLPSVLIISPKGEVIMKNSDNNNSKKFLKWAREANEVFIEQQAAKEAESKAVYKNGFSCSDKNGFNTNAKQMFALRSSAIIE